MNVDLAKDDNIYGVFATVKQEYGMERELGQSDTLGEPLNVLLVEDNPAHAELVQRSFEHHRVVNRIYHVDDGEAALDFLFQRGNYNKRTAPRPHCVLLDLRIPRVDGLEVLRQIKTSDQLSALPVIILTTSAAEQDVAKAYKHHANSYIVKPMDYEKFTSLMDAMGFYWMAWNHYPWPRS